MRSLRVWLSRAHVKTMRAADCVSGARVVAALVPMPRLLAELGFTVNERTHRAPCVLHGGSNPTAFSWTDAGLWKCHSCGAGGDKITLICQMRQCSFREAVGFLRQLGGVEYRPGPVSRGEIERAKQTRARAERASWRVHDELLRLRRYYADALHRADRLCWVLGERLRTAPCEADAQGMWDALARLAPAATFFLSAFTYLNRADDATLVRLALASPGQRRALIFIDDDAHTQLQAA